MQHRRESSRRSSWRVAGILYLISIVTAASAEALARGRMLFALGLVAVLCYVAVTLILYRIFRPVHSALAALAVLFNLAGLILEALQLNPKGVDIALAFHGLYCFLIGYLAFRSAFIPRVLGALMGVGAVGWMSYLLPSLASRLFPFNLVTGLVCEAALMLWLLIASLSAVTEPAG